MSTLCNETALEPVCCEKQQKSSWPITGLRNRGPVKDLNDSKLSPSDFLIIQDQFHTVQNLQKFPILQTSNWSGTFFAVSYSKPALVDCATCIQSDIHNFGFSFKSVFTLEITLSTAAAQITISAFGHSLYESQQSHFRFKHQSVT